MIQEKIAQLKAKMAQNSRECEERNRILKEVCELYRKNITNGEITFFSFFSFSAEQFHVSNEFMSVSAVKVNHMEMRRLHFPECLIFKSSLYS